MRAEKQHVGVGDGSASGNAAHRRYDQARYWYMEWVVKDWLGDPQVSVLKEATRAIWFDALCCMFMQDRCGQLVGVVSDLARLCRTTPNNMRAAIDDLNFRGAADVSEKDGIVTLINRRMRREYLARVSAAKRKRKQRGRVFVPDDVTVNVTPDVTAHSKSHPKTQKEKTSGSARSPAPHVLVAEYFAAQWEKKHGHPHPKLQPLHFTKAHALVEAVGSPEKAKVVIDRYLADSDDFVRGHPLTKLLMDSVLNRYLAGDAGPWATEREVTAEEIDELIQGGKP